EAAAAPPIVPQVFRLADLDDWVRAVLPKRGEVHVSGFIRRPTSSAEQPIELLRLDGCEANTVQILIPSDPPISNPLTAAAFTVASKAHWWNRWAAALAFGGVVPPLSDPARLDDILREPGRLRFACDTNGFAKGVAAWLVGLLGERVDLITSAVVDRELQ